MAYKALGHCLQPTLIYEQHNSVMLKCDLVSENLPLVGITSSKFPVSLKVILKVFGYFNEH